MSFFFFFLVVIELECQWIGGHGGPHRGDGRREKNVAYVFVCWVDGPEVDPVYFFGGRMSEIGVQIWSATRLSKEPGLTHETEAKNDDPMDASRTRMDLVSLFSRNDEFGMCVRARQIKENALGMLSPSSSPLQRVQVSFLGIS